MKKKVLLMLAVVWAFAAQLSAAPVTKAQARSKAQAFMQTKGIALKGELSAVNGPRKVGASRDESTCYYVFNNGQDGGFVIVSGDSRTKEILAYSDTGSFDVDDMPDNVMALMSQYETAINQLGEDNDAEQAVQGQMKASGNVTTPVLPLLTSKWDQDSPYNRTCVFKDSKSVSHTCLSGCVATAMAQVLYYYRNRMPAKLQKEISGYTCSNGYIVPAIAKGTAFNWGYMWDTYVPSLTTTQLNAVANLELICGTAVKSSFTVSYTSAPMSNIATAFVNYFQFSDNAIYLGRANYKTSLWEDMMTRELIAGRPIIYNAVGFSLNHAFVIDGCDGMGMFHANWGWHGRLNGYYTLSLLTDEGPSGEDASVDYNVLATAQNAVIGLQPVNGFYDTVDTPSLLSTINSVSSNVVKVTFKNSTNSDGNFRCGLGYSGADGMPKLFKAWDEGVVNVASNTSTAAISFTLTAADFKNAQLKSGTYELFPIYNLEDQQDWLECSNTSANSISATYDGAQKVTSALAAYTYSLKATDFNFSGSQLAGYPQPVHFNLTNEGSKDFKGYVYLFASLTTTKGSYRQRAPTWIGEGQTFDGLLTFTPNKKGTWNVWIASDASGSNVIGSTKVVISSGTYKRALKVTSVTVENTNSSKPKEVYARQIKGKATIQNIGSGTYSGDVTVFLYHKPASGGSYKPDEGEQVKRVTVAQGETQEIEFDFGQLSNEYIYSLRFFYSVDWNTLSSYNWDGYTIKDGIYQYDTNGILQAIPLTATYTVPDDIAAVDLTGMTGTVTKVVPNSNPNTLYIIGESDKVPTGLTGKNLVKGSTAASIAITDGKPFYAPKDITATKVTYTRTSAIGTNGSGGWEVLIMPFDATKLTYQNVELGWFKSDEDTRKNLWIKEFSSIQGASSVCFDYAQELKANKPYIMAVPDNHWGEVYNLVGKPLVFSAENATIKQSYGLFTGSDVYRFQGSYSASHKVSCWTLRNNGKTFEYGIWSVEPFRGYFIGANEDGDNYTNLSIESTTGIQEMTMMPFAAEGETVPVYNLNGVKVATVQVQDGRISLDGLQRGIYIVNGHKLVK